MTIQKKVNLATWLETKGKEDSSNKVTSLSSSSTDTQYPSAKLVYDELELKLDAADVPTKTSDFTNDGEDGVNAFITAQDITGKEDLSNKVSSTDGWSSTTSDDKYPSEKLTKASLDLKANSADLATVATSGSYTDLSNTPTIDTTITDGSTNAVTGNAIYDALALKSDTGHTHAASEVIDSTAHSNLDTAANATQAAINTAIDTKIGALLSIELITVVSSLPTASADTMNKMYLVAESSAATQDAYEIFITVRTGSSGSYNYAWEKVDTARLDLSGYVRKQDVDLEIVSDKLILTIE